jgi:hypothetical protein
MLPNFCTINPNKMVMTVQLKKILSVQVKKKVPENPVVRVSTPNFPARLSIHKSNRLNHPVKWLRALGKDSIPA